MKNKIIIFIGTLVFLAGGYFALMYYRDMDREGAVSQTADNKAEVVTEEGAGETTDKASTTAEEDSREIKVVAENLNIPWDLAFLPDGNMLVAERPGVLRKIGGEEFSIQVPEVAHIGEGGLLGLVLHPDFAENGWLYLYFTTRTNGTITNMVKRYTLSVASIGEESSILSGIPGASNHNGGRMKFGPDGYLYITTGDAESSSLAQDQNSLAGKILRVDENGEYPKDNPFDNAVYSYGHRNPQGLAWDDKGRLWATEHGRSGVLSGLDELNLIERGENYGWPVIQGNERREGMRASMIQSGPTTTWAPSGAAYHAGSVFFAGLRGQALYEAPIDSEGGVSEIKVHFKNEFGRLRDVIVGPDDYFYLLTSNTDGRGSPRDGDDKIIKIPTEKIISSTDDEKYFAPMGEAEKRITKKTFGMYITPETSPIQPDIFRGFHAGVDWEVFPEELNVDVPVKTVCSGELKLKRMASGYGGVAVQECDLKGEPITVVYGHLKLSSIDTKVSQFIAAGETIGLLGADKSVETDGRRKHLHLAFHRTDKIDIKGYLTNKKELGSWIDPCLYVC